MTWTAMAAGPASPGRIAFFACVCMISLARASTADAARTRQDAGDPQLRRIESLIMEGRLDQARDALETWSDRNQAAPGAVRAAAGLLRGRLARSWTEAEQAYLATALGYPATRQAPEALLRLGQGLLTAANTGRYPDAASRAVAYLERLVTDYPTVPFRAEAFLWLARALHAHGRTTGACARLQQAAIAAADSVTARLIAAERSNRCPTARD